MAVMYLLLIDFDKIFVTRMLRENFNNHVTLFMSMTYGLSMIFTL